jgi:hypothetical protein
MHTVSAPLFPAIHPIRRIDLFSNVLLVGSALFSATATEPQEPTRIIVVVVQRLVLDHLRSTRRPSRRRESTTLFSRSITVQYLIRQQGVLNEDSTMKVLQRLRSARQRSSKASKEKMLQSDPATPSDISSVSSWGYEGSVYSVTRYNSDGVSDTVTDASSLCPQVDELNDDPTSDWGDRGRSRPGNETTMVIYPRHLATQPLSSSICSWCK